VAPQLPLALGPPDSSSPPRFRYECENELVQEGPSFSCFAFSFPHGFTFFLVLLFTSPPKNPDPFPFVSFVVPICVPHRSAFLNMDHFFLVTHFLIFLCLFPGRQPYPFQNRLWFFRCGPP